MFDNLMLKWEYEPEGYDLGDEGWYLPDFWFPQIKMFGEVKPLISGCYEATGYTHYAAYENDVKKCWQLTKMSGHPCLLLFGTPEHTGYWATDIRGFEVCPCSREFCDCTRGDGLCPAGDNEKVRLIDYHFGDHLYWLDEDRLFCNSGDCPSDIPIPFTSGQFKGVHGESIKAARSARFEHGERPR
jgi:hypothetical protein